MTNNNVLRGEKHSYFGDHTQKMDTKRNNNWVQHALTSKNFVLKKKMRSEMRRGYYLLKFYTRNTTKKVVYVKENENETKKL